MEFKLTTGQCAIMSTMLLHGATVARNPTTADDIDHLVRMGLAVSTGHADLLGEGFGPTPFAVSHFYLEGTTTIHPLWVVGYDVPEYLPEHVAYRAYAKENIHRDGETEVDDNAAVHISTEDHGAYVATWVWIEESSVFDMAMTEEEIDG
jgi:hypothetical protein